METGAFFSQRFVIPGIELTDDELEQLTEQFAKATTALRQRDSRYEVRIGIENYVCTVLITAANEREVNALWKKAEQEIRDRIEFRTRKNTPRGLAKRLVMEELTTGPKTIRQIAVATGLLRQSVAYNLQLYIDEGKVEIASERSKPPHPALMYKLVDGTP
jgi:hypothetical protein